MTDVIHVCQGLLNAGYNLYLGGDAVSAKWHLLHNDMLQLTYA